MPLFNPGINASITGNTSGATAVVNSGTFVLAGGNNITLSQNGQSVTISGGAGGGAAATLNGGALNFQSISATNTIPGTNNIYISPVEVLRPVSFSKLRWPFLFNPASSANTTITHSAQYSISLGLYSRTGNTLTSMSTGSLTLTFSYTSSQLTASANTKFWTDFANISGTLESSASYYAVVLKSQSVYTSNSTGGSATIAGNIGWGGAANGGVTMAANWTDGTSSSTSWAPFFGYYSTTSNALPATFGLNEVGNFTSNNGIGAVFQPVFYLAGS